MVGEGFGSKGIHFRTVGFRTVGFRTVGVRVEGSVGMPARTVFSLARSWGCCS